MNRRSMLQVCAGVLALGFGVRAVAQVPGWKICHEKGHQMGSKTYTTRQQLPRLQEAPALDEVPALQQRLDVQGDDGGCVPEGR